MLYSSLLCLLPKQLANWIRASSISNRLRRWANTRKAKKLKANKLAAIAEYGKFNANELSQELHTLNISEGDVLFVQTSFGNLYTLDATPATLLSILRELVGPTGTLLMPAYTIPQSDEDWVFDPAREPTYTGIVNEIFRRSPGVIRSLHPRHSICGIGLQAPKLLEGHERCARADGIGSPFDKMRFLSNAKILTLGLPKGYVSFLHWIEDIAPEKLPFPVHIKKPIKLAIQSEVGKIEILDYQIKSTVSNRLRLKNVSDNLTEKAMLYKYHKGIGIGVYPIMTLGQELSNLRDRGIIHYY